MKKRFAKTMKWLTLWLVFVQMIFINRVLEVHAAKEAGDGPDPNFHIYIAIGQSNMEGQAAIESIDQNCDKDFMVMCTADHYSYQGQVREFGKWYTATPPLAHSEGAKLGMADYFGRLILKEKKKENPDVKVGVIVVAVSGTSIQLFDEDIYEAYLQSGKNPVNEEWYKRRVNEYGGNPYKRLIEAAKIAQKDGVIKGIIMHQGEADEKDATWPQRVKKIYNNIICDLELGDDIPLLAGETLWGGEHEAANENVSKLPQQDKRFYTVSSKGLTEYLDDGHSTHFTAWEYREFGRRYAEKMLEVEAKTEKSALFRENQLLEKVTVAFKDIENDAWYVDAIQAVVNAGIMKGTGINSFCPQVRLTRGQFVTALYNMEKFSFAKYSRNEYSDVRGNEYYALPIMWATQCDIACGTGNGKFSPDANITREQMAVMLYRYAKLKGYRIDSDLRVLNSFPDNAKVSSWAKEAMAWAVKNEIINGKRLNMEKRILDPLGQATRSECAQMLVNFMNVAGK